MKGLHLELRPIIEQKARQTRTFEQLITDRMFTHFSQQNLEHLNCLIDEIFINEIRVIRLQPKQLKEHAPCFIWFHGGGMVFGNPDDSIPYVAEFVHVFQAVVLIPQYRLAPENPYPAALEDCFQTFTWTYEQAKSLHINANKIILSGGSAGGNLALAVALKARDTQTAQVAAILPLYPMLDAKERSYHKQFTSPAIWNHEKNQKSWNAYLQNEKIPPAYASPFYADVEHLPPMYTFIGTHDLFYEEVCEFVEKLKTSNIAIQFDIYEGCTHGFDLEPIPIAKKAKTRLLEVTEKLLNGSIKALE